jgi:type II secretory pathway pseudopilin PulG
MRRISTRGFTIVELVVVITATTILAGVLFGPLDSLYSSNTKSTTKVVQIQDVHNTLRSMQALIVQSSGFLATNQYNATTNPQGVNDPSGTVWRATTSSTLGSPDSTLSPGSNVLITSNYATTTNTNTTDQTNAATNNDQTLAKSVAADATCSVPLQNNYVYFLDTATSTLWRRLISNTTSSCSGSVIQKQSCITTNTSGYCKTRDIKVATGVSAFTVNYCSSASSDISACTATPASVVSTIIVSLTIQTGVGLNVQSTSSNLRITRIN